MKDISEYIKYTNENNYNREQKGVTIWNIIRIFNMLPYSTCFTLKIYSDQKNLSEEVTVRKDTENLIEDFFQENEQNKKHFENILSRYSKTTFSNAKMEWNSGFGNSIVLEVYSPETK